MTTSITWQTGERQLLEAAFQSFDQAAQTLQQSYGTLTRRVEQMDLELAQSNGALRQQLHDNEAMRSHLDGILESLETGVVVLDDAGLITRCNVSAARLLGMTPSALEGHDGDEILDWLGLTVTEHPQRIGQTIVTIGRAALTSISGGGSGSLLLIHDVTRIYQLEEQLQRKERLAAMGEMIGRIAHEIRNPLGSVELFASMLRRDLADMPGLKTYAEQISHAVHGMDRLLANLLVYTKPERTPRAWHHAERMILDSLTLAAHAITKVSVDLRLDLDPRIPSLWCHEGQLKQVCLNLIINAAQAMPAGGVLTISLKPEPDHLLGLPAVCLTVTDSGPGIDAGFRSRIFDPFFTTKDEGTGLGLAIVHAIVEAHQGRIDVDSVVGRGTSFTIILPHPEPIGLVEREQAPAGNRFLRGTNGADTAEPLMLMEETAHD
jgi:two-component system sensor histidine kinase FlrB